MDGVATLGRNRERLTAPFGRGGNGSWSWDAQDRPFFRPGARAIFPRRRTRRDDCNGRDCRAHPTKGSLPQPVAQASARPGSAHQVIRVGRSAYPHSKRPRGRGRRGQGGRRLPALGGVGRPRLGGRHGREEARTPWSVSKRLVRSWPVYLLITTPVAALGQLAVLARSEPGRSPSGGEPSPFRGMPRLGWREILGFGKEACLSSVPQTSVLGRPALWLVRSLGSGV